MVVPEPAEIGDVTDVIPDPRLLDVFPLELPSVELLEPGDRLDHGDAVVPSASQVVDGGDARTFGEGEDCGADVGGVEIVAHLLSPVAEHLVVKPVADST